MARRARLRDAPPKRFTPCQRGSPKASCAARGHLQALLDARGVSAASCRSALGPPAVFRRVTHFLGAARRRPWEFQPFAPASRRVELPGELSRTSRVGSLDPRLARPRRHGPWSPPRRALLDWPTELGGSGVSTSTPPVRRPLERCQVGRWRVSVTANRAGGACRVRALRRESAGIRLGVVRPEPSWRPLLAVGAPRGAFACIGPSSPQLLRVRRRVESQATRWPRSSRDLSRSKVRCRAVLHPLSLWQPRGATVVFSGEPANGVERACAVGRASSRRIAGLERPAPACRLPPKRRATSPLFPPAGTEVSARLRSEERLGTTVESGRSRSPRAWLPKEPRCHSGAAFALRRAWSMLR